MTLEKSLHFDSCVHTWIILISKHLSWKFFSVDPYLISYHVKVDEAVSFYLKFFGEQIDYNWNERESFFLTRQERNSSNKVITWKSSFIL